MTAALNGALDAKARLARTDGLVKPERLVQMNLVSLPP